MKVEDREAVSAKIESVEAAGKQFASHFDNENKNGLVKRLMISSVERVYNDHLQTTWFLMTSKDVVFSVGFDGTIFVSRMKSVFTLSEFFEKHAYSAWSYVQAVTVLQKLEKIVKIRHHTNWEQRSRSIMAW